MVILLTCPNSNTFFVLQYLLTVNTIMTAYCSVADSGVCVEGRYHRGNVLFQRQRRLQSNIAIVEHSPIGVPDLEDVGIGQVWVAQENGVIVELDFVKVVFLPLLIQHEG